MRLKAKEIYSHITQGQKNDKLFSDSAGWLTCFKSQYNIKNGKLAGEAVSVEQIVQPRTSFYISPYTHVWGLDISGLSRLHGISYINHSFSQ